RLRRAARRLGARDRDPRPAARRPRLVSDEQLARLLRAAHADDDGPSWEAAGQGLGRAGRWAEAAEALLRAARRGVPVGDAFELLEPPLAELAPGPLQGTFDPHAHLCWDRAEETLFLEGARLLRLNPSS